jgi:DNA-binding NtrC family response regulator
MYIQSYGKNPNLLAAKKHAQFGHTNIFSNESIRILIIEDQTDIRNALERALSTRFPQAKITAPNDAQNLTDILTNTNEPFTDIYLDHSLRRYPGGDQGLNGMNITALIHRKKLSERIFSISSAGQIPNTSAHIRLKDYNGNLNTDFDRILEPVKQYY